jgi:hypothetical protein
MSLGTINFADATYVIKLKNGNEYVTNRYWHEGTQVLFDAEGGIFGVDQAFVNKIENTDKVIRVASAARQDPSDKFQTETAKETMNKEANTQEPKKKPKEPDDPIVGELDRLKEKSKEVDGMLTSEIRELLDQITALRTKLVKDSKLFIEYSQEVNDIFNLSNSVEASLRSRTN